MLLNDDSRWVRLILRIYFNVVFIIVGLVGDRCIVYSAKLQILKNKNVEVLRLTSWLKSFDPVMLLLRTHRLPAGWLGGLMIICVALAFVSDIAVSTLVRAVQISARCPFDTGLISPTNDPLSVIPVNGSPYIAVLNAQLNSIANGGSMGIYGKVNEDHDFQAQPEDIAGGWVCNDQEQDQIYQLGTSQVSIVEDLVNKNILFSTQPHSESSGSNKSFTHFVVVTSSQEDGAQQPFDIRASVQQEANSDEQKTMKSYDCSMNAPTLEWVLANASSQAILTEWILTFQGSMYNGTRTNATADAASRLDLVLNSMVMIGAGGNYLLSVAPPGSTQGCLAQGTLIPTAMLAIFAIVTFIFVALLLYLIVLVVRYYSFPSSSRSQISTTPNGLVDWIVQAAQASLSGKDETSIDENVTAGQLRQWLFGFNGGNDDVQLRLFKVGQEQAISHNMDQGIELLNGRRHGGIQTDWN